MYFPVSAADVLRECAVLQRNRVLPRLFLPDVLRSRAGTHEYALRNGICCIHVPRQTKSDAVNENKFSMRYTHIGANKKYKAHNSKYV